MNDVPPTMSEAELLRELQMGNAKAFEMLMGRYYKSLYSYATKFGVEKETAKDCVQEVFLSLWQRKEKACAILSLKYYLLLAVKNQVLNTIHRSKPTTQLYEQDGRYPFLVELAVDKVLSDQQALKDNALRLEKIIQQLSAKQKEIVYLKFYEQLDHGQISGIMNISHQSVYNLLHESIKRIRSIWKAEFGTGVAYILLNIFLLGAGV